MKKLTYLLGLLIAGSLIFTSCGEDDPVEPQDVTPTIAFETGGEDVNAVVGDTVKFSVVCASNSVSGKKLDKFRIYAIIDNVEYPTPINITDIDDKVYSGAFDYPLDYVFTGKLYSEITDVDGEKSSISFNITVEEATTPLEGEGDLEWIRVGGNDGDGLDMFGLKWDENGKKDDFAFITKDDAEKFVKLEAAQWETIETKEDLMAAVEAAEDLGDEGYRDVNVTQATSTYDDVLATKYNDEYFILHITNATSDFDPNIGTTVTITGKYNK